MMTEVADTTSAAGPGRYQFGAVTRPWLGGAYHSGTARLPALAIGTSRPVDAGPTEVSIAIWREPLCATRGTSLRAMQSSSAYRRTAHQRTALREVLRLMSFQAAPKDASSPNRRIVIMCDYGADPVWRRDDEVGVNLDDLPLDESTRQALRRWAGRFDARFDPGRDPPHEGNVEFDAEGRRLWLRVRDELGPAWTVSYYSEAEGQRLD